MTFTESLGKTVRPDRIIQYKVYLPVKYLPSYFLVHEGEFKKFLMKQ
jgi:hypothetical protein